MVSPSSTRAPADTGLSPAAPPAGRSRAVWLYVACGLVVALAYYLVPASGLAPRTVGGCDSRCDTAAELERWGA